MLRFLFNALTIRRLRGRVIALPMGVGGRVVDAGWLGCDLLLADGDLLHLSYATPASFYSGPAVTAAYQARIDRNREEEAAEQPPAPALSPTEVTAILAGEAA